MAKRIRPQVENYSKEHWLKRAKDLEVELANVRRMARSAKPARTMREARPLFAQVGSLSVRRKLRGWWLHCYNPDEMRPVLVAFVDRFLQAFQEWQRTGGKALLVFQLHHYENTFVMADGAVPDIFIAALARLLLPKAYRVVAIYNDAGQQSLLCYDVAHGFNVGI